ncbi:MAG TPA: copper amine oxidase N-terminal domain-containing protein [Tissierellia bacterium]|nr:copper amine oxidase N-terminal domain-containing protein [Tissierellia bacterium]
MKVLKKVVVTALAASLMVVPLMSNAEGDIEGNVKEVIEFEEPEQLKQEFIGFYGTIKEIQEEEGRLSIVVENDQEEPGNIAIFYVLEETFLVSNKTMDIVDRSYLEEGMKVMAYYPSDIILPMIYPPRIPADVVAVMENEEYTNVEVYRFDENLLSTDGILQIFPDEETVIVDREGNLLKKEDIRNSKAVVFYGIAELSLPAKAVPQKVIVLKEQLKDTGRAVIEGVETVLNKPMYMKDNTIMVPLRQIAEALGYEVKWNGENYSVEIMKGAHWFLVKIGEDDYNFAKMKTQLGIAPELVDSTTYVPVEFLELMGLNVDIAYDGVLNINNN